MEEELRTEVKKFLALHLPFYRALDLEAVAALDVLENILEIDPKRLTRLLREARKRQRVVVSVEKQLAEFEELLLQATMKSGTKIFLEQWKTSAPPQ